MNARSGLTLVVVGLLGLAGCATSGEATEATDGTGATTGNMVSDRPVTAPTEPQWFAGQLVVEPAGAGRACLLLDTGDATYVLRSARTDLQVMAWQRDGAFDATRSGIVRDGRLVAPYGDERTSVRGQVAAQADAECGTHPTLAIARAARGDRTAPSPEPEPEASNAPDPGEGDDGADEVFTRPPVTTMSGTLTVVRGNQGEGYCLAIDTAVGAYTLGSSSKAYDVVVSELEGGVDERRTGIHHHGRNSLGMYASVGQHVELRGRLWGDNTDFSCSGYYGFGITDVVR